MAGRALPFVEFVERVVGVKLTDAQCVLSRVGFDGEDIDDLDAPEREIARELFGAIATVPVLALGVIVMVAGARSGKSYLAALRLVHLALTVPLDHLAPGEQAVGLIVAPDVRLAKQCLRFALGAVRSVPHLGRLVATPTSDAFAIRRPDGRVVAIECLPATRGGSAVRGRSLVGAVLDEFAFFRDEQAAVNDADLFRAVSPRVMTGGQVIIASTPWGESGLLYEMHRDQHGAPITALVAHAPTALMRPSEAKRVKLEFARDPANASRELGAEFLSIGQGSFFDAAAIRKCVDTGRAHPLGARLGARAIAACDFGFSSDHSAIVVVRAEDELLVVADWLELRPRKGAPLKPSEVVREFARIARAHGCSGIVADAHYREAIREHLSRYALGFTSAEGGINGKLANYRAAQSLIHEGRVVLPDDARLLNQIRAVQVRPTPGGGMSITHPRRAGAGHGDWCAALVVALAHSSRTLLRSLLPGAGASVGRLKSEFADTSWGDSLDRIQVDPYGSGLIVGRRPRSSSTFGGGSSFGGF
jgi:hypothetical protein